MCVSIPDAVNKKECIEAGEMKIRDKREIKRPPSIDNIEKEFCLVPAAANNDKQKAKKMPNHGWNPVKFYSELTKVIFEEEKAKEAVKNSPDSVKESDIVPPPNIPVEQELKLFLADERKAENKEDIPRNEEKKNKPRKKPKKGKKRSHRHSKSGTSSDSESDSDCGPSDIISDSDGSTDSGK